MAALSRQWALQPPLATPHSSSSSSGSSSSGGNMAASSSASSTYTMTPAMLTLRRVPVFLGPHQRSLLVSEHCVSVRTDSIPRARSMLPLDDKENSGAYTGNSKKYTAPQSSAKRPRQALPFSDIAPVTQQAIGSSAHAAMALRNTVTATPPRTLASSALLVTSSAAVHDDEWSRRPLTFSLMQPLQRAGSPSKLRSDEAARRREAGSPMTLLDLFPLPNESPSSASAGLDAAVVRALQAQTHELRQYTRQLEREIVAMKSAVQNETADACRAVMKQACEHYTGMLTEMERRYLAERASRRTLHNQLQELLGNIRVFCRIRPVAPNDAVFGAYANDVIVQRTDDETVHLQDRAFQFDRVFGPTASQEQVFESAEPLIVSLLDGYNVCVMSYGRTASGKTFSLMGPHHVSDVPPTRRSNSAPLTSSQDPQRGLVARSVQKLFALMRASLDTTSYHMSLSMLQIHNNSVMDLLQEPEKATTTKYDVRVTAEGAVDVTNLMEVPVTTVHETLACIDRGFAQRAVSATELNAHSSRSHCIISIHVTSQDKTGVARRSKLTFVDLAGSECVALSQVSGVAAQETSHINRSLSALSDVLMALAENRPHVPYRNSKLTHVLQDTLGGDAKMLLLLCVSPIGLHSTESMQSLQFGQRAACVQRIPASRQTRPSMRTIPPTPPTPAAAGTPTEPLRRSFGSAGTAVGSQSSLSSSGGPDKGQRALRNSIGGSTAAASSTKR